MHTKEPTIHETAVVLERKLHELLLLVPNQPSATELYDISKEIQRLFKQSCRLITLLRLESETALSKEPARSADKEVATYAKARRIHSQVCKTYANAQRLIAEAATAVAQHQNGFKASALDSLEVLKNSATAETAQQELSEGKLQHILEAAKKYQSKVS